MRVQRYASDCRRSDQTPLLTRQHDLDRDLTGELLGLATRPRFTRVIVILRGDRFEVGVRYWRIGREENSVRTGSADGHMGANRDAR